MTRRSSLPIALTSSPFSVESARETGVSAGRLRARDLRRPFRGVRVVDGVEVDSLLAYAVRMSPRAFFSHASAARLWGFPLPRRLNAGPIHVCVVKPDRAPRMSGVAGHHCQPGSVSIVTHRGLRLSDPIDTWCALSSQLSLDELVIAGDWLVKRKNPLAELGELHERVAAFSGRPGARLLSVAATLVRARTDSPRETLSRLALMRAGLPEPAVNFEIRDTEGRFVAFGDLAFSQYKVLVEYDGAQHREDEEQFHRDVNRLDDIMQLDWRVVRINKSHTKAQVVARATAALRSRGWTP